MRLLLLSIKTTDLKKTLPYFLFFFKTSVICYPNLFCVHQKKDNNVCKDVVYNTVYNANAKTIFNFIYYKCGDSAKAKDIVQDTFIKLWENCSKVPVENAKAFLYNVARNTFLNVVKADNVRLKHKPNTSNSTNETPEFVLEEKEYSLKLEKAIANLTEANRTAFLLNRIDGKKYREIAEMLGISVKAVEKRIHKALQSLRKEIDGI